MRLIGLKEDEFVVDTTDSVGLEGLSEIVATGVVPSGDIGGGAVDGDIESVLRGLGMAGWTGVNEPAELLIDTSRRRRSSKGAPELM